MVSVALRHLSVMCSLFMVAVLMVLGGILVVSCRGLLMFGSLMVVLGGGLAHVGLLSNRPEYGARSL
jgi:hypothetical protein